MADSIPYTTLAKIKAKIPPEFVTGALTDGDGRTVDEVFADLLAAASTAVDAFLSSLYTTPFVDPPAVVQEAAFTFVCEMIYDRRQVLDRNPFKARADFWRERLAQIGDGKIPLSAATATEFAPGVAITEAVRLDSTLS